MLGEEVHQSSSGSSTSAYARIEPSRALSGILHIAWVPELNKDCVPIVHDLGFDLQAVAFGHLMRTHTKRRDQRVGKVLVVGEVVDLSIHPILPRVRRRASLSGLEVLYDPAHCFSPSFSAASSITPRSNVLPPC